MQALKFDAAPDAELDADDPALLLGAVLEPPVPGA
jgi:hypothetical protein